MTRNKKKTTPGEIQLIKVGVGVLGTPETAGDIAQRMGLPSQRVGWVLENLFLDTQDRAWLQRDTGRRNGAGVALWCGTGAHIVMAKINMAQPMFQAYPYLTRKHETTVATAERSGIPEDRCRSSGNENPRALRKFILAAYLAQFFFELAPLTL